MIGAKSSRYAVVKTTCESQQLYWYSSIKNNYKVQMQRSKWAIKILTAAANLSNLSSHMPR